MRKAPLALFCICLGLSAKAGPENCMEVGAGVELRNDDNAFVNYFLMGRGWRPIDGNGDLGYTVSAPIPPAKPYNPRTYWKYKAGDGEYNYDYTDLMTIQGKFRDDGYPVEIPMELKKHDGSETITIERLDRWIDIPWERNGFIEGTESSPWVFKWEGTGEVRYGGIGEKYTGENTSTGRGRITFRHKNGGAISTVSIRKSDPSDPIRRIAIIRPGQEALYDAGESFQPNFIERVSKLNTIRFLGYSNAWNDVKGFVSSEHPYYRDYFLSKRPWDFRADKDYCLQRTNMGGAYEFIIELANKAQVNPWIHIPYCADDNYIRRMAALFRDNLDPDLTIYLEYSNEIWNWLNVVVVSRWLEGRRHTDYPGLDFYRAAGRQVGRAQGIWTEEFGSKDMQRVVRVVGLQGNWTDVNNRMMSNVGAENFDAAATSWYFNIDDNAEDRPNPATGNGFRRDLYNLWRDNRNSILQQEFTDTLVSYLKQSYRLYGHEAKKNTVEFVKNFGLDKKVACYEGGNHLLFMCNNGINDDIPLCDKNNKCVDVDDPDCMCEKGWLTEANHPFVRMIIDAVNTPEMEKVYTEVLDSMEAIGVVEANALSLYGGHSCFGAWGLIKNPWIEDPLNGPDTQYPYKAIADFVTSRQCHLEIRVPANNKGAGLALKLDGRDDYVDADPVAYKPSENEDYSIEFWAKPTFGDVEQTIVSFTNSVAGGDYNSITVREDNRIVWRIGVDEKPDMKLPGPSLQAGSWYHVAAVKRGIRYTLYVNGHSAADVNKALSGGSYSRFAVGGFVGENGLRMPFTGDVDEVRIWNTAREADEIRDFMCKKIPDGHSDDSNLKTYFRFDTPDYASGGVYDRAAAGNTAVIRNMAFRERSSYVISGAPIGDISRNRYESDWTNVGMTFSHPSGDRVAVSNMGSGSPNGVHIYFVNAEPHYNSPPEFYDGLAIHHHFGVFMANGVESGYDLTYLYGGHPDAKTGTEEDKNRLLRRDGAAIEEWLHAGGQIDLTARSLTVRCKERNRGEYTLGFRRNNIVPRPGPGKAIHFKQKAGTSENDGGRIRFLSFDDYTLTAWVKGTGSFIRFAPYIGGGTSESISLRSVHGGGYVFPGYSFSTNYSKQGFGSGQGLPTIAPDDEWVHLAVTRKGTRVTVYANGRKIGEKDFIGNFTRSKVYLFDPPDYGGGDLQVDELAVWNTALDRETIRDWMCRKITEEHPYECENLLLYYTFDEGKGKVLEDIRGHSDLVFVGDSVFYVESGAPIGTESVHDYKSANDIRFDHPDGDYLEASATKGAPLGVHLYRVDNTPPANTGIRLSDPPVISIDSSRYWGIFPVLEQPHRKDPVGEYAVTYHYDGNARITSGNEADLRILSRINNADTSWIPLMDNEPDEQRKMITLSGQYKAEYLIGGVSRNTFTPFVPPETPVFVTPTGGINRDTVCANSSGLPYKVAYDPDVTTYTWVLPQGLDGYSTGDSIFVNASIGMNSPPRFLIKVVAHNNYGASDTARYSIWIAPAPTQADGGPDQVIIPPSVSAVMDGNPAGENETGRWSIGASGAGIPVDAHDPKTRVQSLASGVNYLVWTISGNENACPASSDTVRILSAPTPVGVFETTTGAMPRELCQGGTYTFEAVPYEDTDDFIDGYQWTFPSGIRRISGEGPRATVVVDSGIGGVIEVRAVYGDHPSEPYFAPDVFVRAKPVKPILVEKPNLLCKDGVYNYRAVIDPSIDRYEWSTSSKLIVPTAYPPSTDESISLKVLDTVGRGYVTVKAYNGPCSCEEATDTVYVTTGLAPEPPVFEAEKIWMYSYGPMADMCKYQDGLIWLEDDPAAEYNWTVPPDLEVEFYGKNKNIAHILNNPHHVRSLEVTKTKGEGDCNVSASNTVRIWAHEDRDDMVQPDPIQMIAPEDADPMKLDVGAEYTFQTGGGAEYYFWLIPDAFQVIDVDFKNRNNYRERNFDSVVTVRVLEKYAGYIKVFGMKYEGCVGKPTRIGVCSNGPGNCLLPPEYESGDVEICSGTNLNITVSAIPGATEYVWTLPNGSEFVTQSNVLDELIDIRMKGKMRVVARNESTESEPNYIFIRVLGVPMDPVVFVDEDNNPISYLEICRTDRHRPVFIRDVGGNRHVFDIHGGNIFFDNSTTEDRGGPKDYDTDTVAFVSYVDWRHSEEPGYIVVTVENGCGSPVKDSLLYYLVVPPADQMPRFSEAPTSVCVGATVTYKIEEIQSAEDYVWTLPPGLEADTLVTSLPEITVRAVDGIGGPVKVYATSSVCGGGISPRQETDSVAIMGGANVDFRFLRAPLTACPGEKVEFIVNDASASGYTWSFPNGLLPDIPGSDIRLDNKSSHTTLVPAEGWKLESESGEGYMDDDYAAQVGGGGPEKYVLYSPDIKVSGKYRVYFSYKLNGNGGWDNFDVDVKDEYDIHTIRCPRSLRKDPEPHERIYHELLLGTFQFDNNGSAYVKVRTENARGVTADRARFVLSEEFTSRDTAVEYLVTGGDGGSVCVTMQHPMCESGYSVCTIPVDLGGNMHRPIIQAQETSPCITGTYTYTVSDIDADSYTWILPEGLSIHEETGVVEGQERTVEVTTAVSEGVVGRIGVFGVLSACDTRSDTAFTETITAVANCSAPSLAVPRPQPPGGGYSRGELTVRFQSSSQDTVCNIYYAVCTDYDCPMENAGLYDPESGIVLTIDETQKILSFQARPKPGYERAYRESAIGTALYRLGKSPSHAAYFDRNADGKIDRVQVWFDSEIESMPDSIIAWAPWDGSVIRKGIPSRIDSRTLVLDFSDTPYPQLKTEFASGKYGQLSDSGGQFDTAPYMVFDSVAPVIISADYKMVGTENSGYLHDTLIVVFSEPVSVTGTDLFTFETNATDMRIENLSVEGKTLRSIVRVPVTDKSNTLQSGDRISIRTDRTGTHISDQKGNVQNHPENRMVDIRVHPTKDFFRIRYGPTLFNPERGRFTIVLEPNERVSVLDRSSKASIKIFDNTGDLVQHDRFGRAEDKLIYTWLGRNRQSRMVGEGTYLAIIEFTMDGISNGRRIKIAVKR